MQKRTFSKFEIQNQKIYFTLTQIQRKQLRLWNIKRIKISILNPYITFTA